MTGHVIVPTPGTVSHVLYHRPTIDGKYQVVVHGTVEEQIAEAQKTLRENHSGRGHEPMPLYVFASDCEHSDPEEDEKFNDVDDQIDAWLDKATNGLGSMRPSHLDSVHWGLYYKNRSRAFAVLPIAWEYSLAMDLYGDLHSGNVCLASEMGSACRACSEDDLDEDFGIEPGGCRREDESREERDMLWYLTDPENHETKRSF